MNVKQFQAVVCAECRISAQNSNAAFTSTLLTFVKLLTAYTGIFSGASWGPMAIQLVLWTSFSCFTAISPAVSVPVTLWSYVRSMSRLCNVSPTLQFCNWLDVTTYHGGPGQRDPMDVALNAWGPWLCQWYSSAITHIDTFRRKRMGLTPLGNRLD